MGSTPPFSPGTSWAGRGLGPGGRGVPRCQPRAAQLVPPGPSSPFLPQHSPWENLTTGVGAWPGKMLPGAGFRSLSPTPAGGLQLSPSGKLPAERARRLRRKARRGAGAEGACRLPHSPARRRGRRAVLFPDKRVGCALEPPVLFLPHCGNKLCLGLCFAQQLPAWHQAQPSSPWCPAGRSLGSSQRLCSPQGRGSAPQVPPTRLRPAAARAGAQAAG